MAVGPGRRGQAGRRPGRNEVAGAEREMVAEERDDRGDREPHLRGASVLDRLAVDRAPELEIGGVQLADGNEARSRRAEPGHRFADEPLVAVERRVARRHVVPDGVDRPGSEEVEMHRAQAVTVGSARSGATAARMTSAMPPTPVQRSNAIAAWAMSISEPFAARSPRARAAARSGVSTGT